MGHYVPKPELTPTKLGKPSIKDKLNRKLNKMEEDICNQKGMLAAYGLGYTQAINDIRKLLRE